MTQGPICACLRIPQSSSVLRDAHHPAKALILTAVRDRRSRRADDWEDWEDESFEPKLTPVAAPAATAAAVVVQQKAAEQEEDKFAGEDEGEDEPAYKAHIPEPQQVSWRTDALSDCLWCASSSRHRQRILVDCYPLLLADL